MPSMKNWIFAIVCLVAIFLTLAALDQHSARRHEYQAQIDNRLRLFDCDNLASIEATVLNEAVFVGLPPGTTANVPLSMWSRVERHLMHPIVLGTNRLRPTDLMRIRLITKRGDIQDMHITLGGHGGMEFRIGDVLCTRPRRNMPRSPALDESAILVLILASCHPTAPAELKENVGKRIDLLEKGVTTN